jgi:hypothetical protein
VDGALCDALGFGDIIFLVALFLVAVCSSAGRQWSKINGLGNEREVGPLNGKEATVKFSGSSPNYRGLFFSKKTSPPTNGLITP